MEKKDGLDNDCTRMRRKVQQQKHSVTGFAPSYLMNGTDASMLPKELRKEPTKQDWIQDKKKSFGKLNKVT